MSLSNLPLELLREILGWAIQVRGVKRGVRLRLVNSKIGLARLTVWFLLTSNCRGFCA
jgi:hypothetical protein